MLRLVSPRERSLEHLSGEIAEHGMVARRTFANAMRVRVFACGNMHGMEGSWNGKREEEGEDGFDPRFCVQVFSAGWGDLLADLPSIHACEAFIGTFIKIHDFEPPIGDNWEREPS